MTLEQENAQLRAENAELRPVVAQLQAQLAAVLKRIAELEQRCDDPPPFAKPNRDKAAEPKPPRKQRAPHHNHARRREEPTRIVSHVLEHCPTCDYRLRGTSIDYTRHVIELPPPPRVEVTEQRVIKRWCPRCPHWRRPNVDLHGQIVGQGRRGVRLIRLIAYLRTTVRVPIGCIQRYLQTLHHLTISAGEIVELLHHLRRTVQPAVEVLKQQARASPRSRGVSIRARAGAGCGQPSGRA